MRNVLWICAAAASALAMADARGEGDGLSTNADRAWTRFQSRIAFAPGAPGWRADLVPVEKTGLQVGSLGLLGDMYFGGTQAAAGAPSSGFRATSGVLIGARSPLLSTATTPSAGGLYASNRHLFGAAPGTTRRQRRVCRQLDRSLHRHRLQQSLARRAAGASAPTSAWSRRARATSSASAASSAARRASTTSSATCASPRSSSSASPIPSEPLGRAFPGTVA